MNLEQVQTFIEKNRRELNDKNKLARCVDGRYENIADMPLAAKPGADAGDLMALFGALNILGQSLPDEAALKIIIDSLGGAQNFRFHTDDHADQSVPGIGCGHIKQAKLDPESYGVTAEQMEFILNELPKLLEQGANQEVLHDDHAEQAVVVIDSANFGIEPLLRNSEEVQEAFVYQKTLHDEQLRNIARKTHESLLESGATVEEQEVRKALDDAFGKQLTETLKRLANGLPIYTAKIDAAGTVEIME